MSERREHVIQDRPQISVTANDYQEIVISVAGISEDFSKVEHNDVVIPGECAEEVANAILRLIGK